MSRLRLAVVLFLVPIVSTYSQQLSTTTVQTAPALSPQATVLLIQASSALGASSAASITDTVMQAFVTNSSDPGARPSAVTIKSKGSGMLRWESTISGKQSIVVSNRGTLREYNGTSWRTSPSANAIHQRMIHLPALLIAQENARADLAGSFIADETLNGRTVHHLKLSRISNVRTSLDAKLTKASEIELFVDAQTGLIAKISMIWLSDTDWRQGVPLEIYYDQYETVNGIKVPFYQRTVFNGQSTTEMRVTSVQCNVGLTDAEFQGR